MTKSKKAEIQHNDKLGQPITLDCCVAFPDANSLYIGKVTKINPKMIKIAKITKNNSRYRSEVNKYSYDTVILDSAAVTMWLLSNS